MAFMPVILAACGAGSEAVDQSDTQAESQAQPELGQLADISQPVSAGSQHDLMPRVESVLAAALPGRLASDESDGAVGKRTTTAAYDEVAYSVDTVFGASARDWATQQWDKSSSYGLMGVLNESVAKRLCMLSYWTGSAGNAYELTAVQRSIGVDAEDLTGKAGEALQGFCPALTENDLAMLSAAEPLQIWYEVSDLSGQPGSHYERVLRYQFAGSASSAQDGFSISGQFFYTISTESLRFVLTEQADSEASFYVALNADASREKISLEGQRMTGSAETSRQAIYRLRLDGSADEAAVLVHAHEAVGYPATDLAVLMTSKAQAGGQVAVSVSADGIDSLRDAFVCADRDSLRVDAIAGISGVCDGAVAVTSSPWLTNGKPLLAFDPTAIEALDETSIVDFGSLTEMLLSAPMTAETSLRLSDEVDQILPR